MRSIHRLLALTLVLLGSAYSHAAIIITEVDPSGSTATNGYAADWFELTNNGPAAVDITGWKMDDNSNLFASAVAIRGITSIAAGQTIVFLEGAATNANDATLQTNFINSWFGGTAPAGFTMGFYGGSSVGLSGTADAVNVFDAGGTVVTRVDFGASTVGTSFDNKVGLTGAVTISTLSVAGVNGAFTAPNNEIGSPGLVPEPASFGLCLVGALGLLCRRGRKSVAL